MSYLVFLSSLIMPVYSLILSIPELLKKHTGLLPIISFSLAFALLSYVMEPPVDSDLSRQVARIEYLKQFNFSYVMEFSRSGYYLFDAYSWTVQRLGLPVNAIPALLVLYGYILKLSIFNNLKKNYLQDQSLIILFISFILVWLPINYFALTSGMRSEFSTIIVLYVSYQLVINNRLNIFIAGAILAFYIHPFSIAPSLIIFISNLLKSYSRYGRVLVAISLFLTFSSGLINLILSYLVSLLSGLDFFSGHYFDTESEFGAGFTETKTIYGIIGAIIIPRIPVYIGILYLILQKEQKPSALYLSLCIMSLYMGIFFSFYTLYGRMMAVFLHVFGLYIILQYIHNKNKLNKFFLIAFTISITAFATFNIYYGRNFLKSATEVLYKPLLFSLFGI